MEFSSVDDEKKSSKNHNGGLLAKEYKRLLRPKMQRPPFTVILDSILMRTNYSDCANDGRGISYSPRLTTLNYLQNNSSNNTEMEGDSLRVAHREKMKIVPDLWLA